jgi:cell wall-associated NlpC family hydrolase
MASGAVKIRFRALKAAVVTVAVLGFLITTATAAADSVTSKRAEADRVIGQIQVLDASVEKAVDAYNAAQIELNGIKQREKENRYHLALAKKSFTQAQKTLQHRLITLYTTGETSTLEVLLGATSIDDLLNRADTVKRVSSEDTRIVKELVRARTSMRKMEKELAAASRRQAAVVAEREARRRDIESQLAERQRLLGSIKTEIARIQAEEAKRQERLKAAAEQVAASEGATSTASWDPVGSEVTAATPPPARYGGVVGVAMRYLGVPYVWGGASPSGFDCSGFVMYVYSQVGVSLPHNAAMQYGYGTPVSRSDLQAGDLVFFDGLGHVGIYIGGGSFIHAPHTGDVVKISSLGDSWYASTYVGARRL